MSSKFRVVVGLAILSMVILAGGTRPDAQATAYQSGCPAPGAPGSLDPYFGTCGVTEFSMGPDSAAIPMDIAVDPDGGILVLGGVYVDGYHQSALARFLSDGKPDPGFGVDADGDGDKDGWLPLPFTTQADPEYAKNVIVVPDLDGLDFDIIVVAEPTTGKRKGKWDWAVGVARLNADGTFVNNWGEDGEGRTIFHFADGEASYPRGAIVDSSGRVVVVGFSGKNTKVALARLSADTGAFDMGFGNNGRVVSDVSGQGWAVGEDSAGGLVVAVSVANAADTLIRFKGAGANAGDQDGAFGPVETGIELSWDNSDTLTIDRGNGRILVAGSLITTETSSGGKGRKGKPTTTEVRDIGIAAFGEDGSADWSFSLDLGGERDAAMEVDVDSIGRIVCSVYLGSGHTDAVVLRLRPNGTLDMDFDHDGYVITDLVYPSEPVLSTVFVLTPVGIVLSGRVGQAETSRTFIARYLQD